MPAVGQRLPLGANAEASLCPYQPTLSQAVCDDRVVPNPTVAVQQNLLLIFRFPPPVWAGLAATASLGSLYNPRQLDRD
jgi:hypothetical protein